MPGRRQHVFAAAPSDRTCDPSPSPVSRRVDARSRETGAPRHEVSLRIVLVEGRPAETNGRRRHREPGSSSRPSIGNPGGISSP